MKSASSAVRTSAHIEVVTIADDSVKNPAVLADTAIAQLVFPIVGANLMEVFVVSVE